jgi:hypothetical protein
VWKWCWCYALPKWWRGEYRYLVVRWSKYIPWIPHVMLTNDLKDAEISESVPAGEKKRGLAGVWHALTSKWTVRKGRDE